MSVAFATASFPVQDMPLHNSRRNQPRSGKFNYRTKLSSITRRNVLKGSCTEFCKTAPWTEGPNRRVDFEPLCFRLFRRLDRYRRRAAFGMTGRVASLRRVSTCPRIVGWKKVTAVVYDTRGHIFIWTMHAYSGRPLLGRPLSFGRDAVGGASHHERNLSADVVDAQATACGVPEHGPVHGAKDRQPERMPVAIGAQR